MTNPIRETVQLRCLGSGDAFGSGGRFNAGFWLETGAGSYLLDCGATTMVALRQADIDPNTIAAIVISHLHGDHFGGLPFFALDAQFVSRRTTPLVIAGPPGLAARTLALMDVMFPGSATAKRRFDLQFVELPVGVATAVGALMVTPFPASHPSGAPTYSLRLAIGDKVLAYSGDTEWSETLLEVARDADLFICECYRFDQPAPYHLDYITLQARRADLACRRLLLTHMSAAMLARLPEVNPTFEIAADGLTLSL